MYIEDVTKPFLVLEGKTLTREDFYLSRRYAVKYFFGGRTRHRIGLALCVMLVIFLLGTIAKLVGSPSNLNYQYILFPIFLFVFVLFLLVILPNEEEKRMKAAYESSEYLQKPFVIRFYKEYFEWENEREYIKTARTDIEKCLESNQMVLLKKKDGMILTIMKEWMTESQFFMLREYLQSVYVYKYKAVE